MAMVAGTSHVSHCVRTCLEREDKVIASGKYCTLLDLLTALHWHALCLLSWFQLVQQPCPLQDCTCLIE